MSGDGGRLAVRVAALAYLAALLGLPLAALAVDALRDGPAAFLRSVSSPAARHALTLTLWTAAATSAINVVMGVLTAFVLVRYRFPGRRLLDAAVDLPLAVPTLVTGVMLLALYGPQRPIGGFLQETLGVRVVFAPLGILMALLLVTFPFVVRTVEPALRTLDRDPEDAAATLGARPSYILRRVTLPEVLPAVAAGALLTFARAVGEFGAVVIVAGNIPLSTQTAAVFVLGEIESENQRGASAVSLLMIGAAFALAALVERMRRRRAGMLG